jgi:hypothetical protein
VSFIYTPEVHLIIIEILNYSYDVVVDDVPTFLKKFNRKSIRIDLPFAKKLNLDYLST